MIFHYYLQSGFYYYPFEIELGAESKLFAADPDVLDGIDYIPRVANSYFFLVSYSITYSGLSYDIITVLF